MRRVSIANAFLCQSAMMCRMNHWGSFKAINRLSPRRGKFLLVSNRENKADSWVVRAKDSLFTMKELQGFEHQDLGM